MKNLFDKQNVTELINRIDKLTPTSKAHWGKMNAASMLAHCNVIYEMVYENIHPKPNAVKKWLFKLFVKNIVVKENPPYKKNSQTAPQLIIKDTRNFELEKKRLVDYIHKTQQLGEGHFDGKESHSFGILTKQEWNTMFSKHLDHHLNQFGV
jgi:Protein of unknown function (DUF1569)